MAIAKESIAAVRERADILAEIGSRVELKKAGSNHVGLCPFHGEKSPSFSVSATKGFFHCFGCGATGDVIEFLMKHDGMLFHEAVKDLGERLGIAIEEDQNPESIRKAQQVRQQASTLEDVCEKANTFFRQQLPESQEASKYAFGRRGLSSAIVEQYGIGYAPAGWKPLSLIFPDYSTSPRLAESGLVSDIDDENAAVGTSTRGTRGRIDRFRDRLIFPIRDVRGHCIGFGGRTINDLAPNAPKYLNSPETPIFQKHKVLYGLHEARAAIMREKTVYVTEGYMDVVMLAQHGIGNAVAAMGTALSEDHVRVLLRFTDRVCFIFDGDKAGKAAAWKSLRVILPFLLPQHSVAFLTLPGAMDPDEYLRQHGKDAFQALTAKAPALSEYLLATLTDQFGSNGILPTIEAKTQFSVAAEELVALLPETNPLKGLLLQSVDVVVGRPARSTAAITPKMSASDRLRMAAAQTYTRDASVNSGSQDGAGGEVQKRPWLSREDFLKTLPKRDAMNKVSSPSYRQTASSANTPLIHERQSLWTQLCNAVVMAPTTAATVANRITLLLDEDSADEMTLKVVLQECGSIAAKPENYPPDVLQSAIDLLLNAHKVIAKLRTDEIRLELKSMFQSGDIDEAEYSSQMLSLAR